MASSLLTVQHRVACWNTQAQQTENIEEYDEALVRRMVEKITVYDDRFTVEFKSGTSVDVER